MGRGLSQRGGRRPSRGRVVRLSCPYTHPLGNRVRPPAPGDRVPLSPGGKAAGSFFASRTLGAVKRNASGELSGCPCRQRMPPLSSFRKHLGSEIWRPRAFCAELEMGKQFCGSRFQEAGDPAFLHLLLLTTPIPPACSEEGNALCFVRTWGLEGAPHSATHKSSESTAGILELRVQLDIFPLLPRPPPPPPPPAASQALLGSGPAGLGS